MGSVALLRRPGIALLTCSLAFTSMLALATGGAASAAGRKAAPADVAPGAPGTESYFDLARKDCVGTATGTRSKVWYTVAGGVLSDTYEPTIDNTNVSTLQYVVTDGSTFTDLQTRDMTYTVAADPTGMACTVTATDAQHGYKLVTTYITDPARDTVLMHTQLSALPGSGTSVAGLHLYARLDAHVNGNGGGGSENAGGNTGVVDTSTGSPVPVIYSTNTVTNAVNRDYAVPTYMALDASVSSPAASVGYAGSASDGLTQLDATHTLTSYDSAPDGHITATEDVTPVHGDSVTLALGFGRDQASAVATASQSLRQPFGVTALKYVAGWLRYDAGLRPPFGHVSGAAARRDRTSILHYYLSANVIKASEDKTYPGAIVASLASPWGQSVPAGNLSGSAPAYFGSYREVFARDLYEAFTGLLVDGDLATARAATRFLFDQQQQADGSMPRNSLLNGKPAPDTGGTQLDETSYPIIMALQAGLDGAVAVAQPHQARRRLPGLAWAVVRRGAVGGADRVLPVHHRRRDRRADRRVGDGRRAPRQGAGAGLPGDGGRLPAHHQVVDGDNDRAVRAELLHPAVQDRRPQRGDHLRPGQRRPDAGPARRAGRRVPGTGPARRTAGLRPGRAGLARRVGQADRGVHAERDRLLPVRQLGRAGQRRRIRRLLPAEPDVLLDRGRAVGAHRHRHRAPVAGAVRRAGRVRRRRGQHARRGVAAERDGELLLRGGPGARAGLGGPGPARLPVRQRPDDGLHRLHRREGGRAPPPR